MHFVHRLQFLDFHCLEGIGLLGAVLFHFEDLPVGALV